MPELNIYDTHYMLGAVREMPLEHTFFKDRYFPTSMQMDVFGTTRVLVDFMNQSQRVAPFVLPRVGSIPMMRDGFSTYDLEPGNISISRPLTIDNLTNRGFGESLMSGMTPADRARTYMMNDLADLSAAISRREEILAVSTMLDNGAVMRHQTDKEGTYIDIPVKFYDGDDNPAEFVPSDAWTHSTKSGETWTRGSFYNDICAMVRMLVSKGRPATDLLVSSDVAEFLMNDGWVLSMLDNRRVELGRIAPEALTPDTTVIATLNFSGHVLNVIECSGTYEEGGEDKPYLPDETVIVTAPDCGRGLYGAVTLMTASGQWETIAGKRIPQRIFTQEPPANDIKLMSRPLFVPRRANPWISAKNVLTGAGE